MLNHVTSVITVTGPAASVDAFKARMFRTDDEGNPGVRYPSSVLTFPQERGLHPTQKPVALIEWLIRTYSDPGQTVLDCTMGSGTTGVAAAKANRRFVGIERDAGYFAVAQRRIEEAVAASRAALFRSAA